MALTLAGCASGLPAPTVHQFEVDGWSGLTRTYRCADGTPLAVAYLNPQRGVAIAVITLAGTQAVLRNLPAASGARYVDVDEQRGLRWHSKGDEGFLALLAPDHTATEQMLHTGCRAQP
ncbi:MliC family protein [Hydrogenophaga atypica]|uniref:MliC family protein n=1 Tax=Hydrogenophaga atypica TaxID=249409 RepID=A0ABW2QF93_9BURK